MPSDDVTPFFDAQNKQGTSTTNSTHASVVSIPVDNGVRYVRIDPPSGGWVSGRKNPNDKNSGVSLCEYTKVKLLKREGGRIYFRVLDGNSGAEGNVLSMPEDGDGAKKYLRKDKREGGITITVRDLNWEEYVHSVQRGDDLVQCAGELHYAGMTMAITLASRIYGNRQLHQPLPASASAYKLMAPDYPHTGDFSRFYRQNPKGQFDLVWFRVDYENDRYLHMGHLSHGCVTVTNINEWERLYHKIISCRSDGDATDKVGGGKYVGEIIASKNSTPKPMNHSPHRLSSF